MNHYLKNNLLLASVFITGFSVLVLEIIATRILSPYYGNTIYTTSSIISVVLFALAVGYFWGGKLADRYPQIVLFYGIIFCSGALVLVTYFWSVTFLPIISNIFSMVIGPLLSSLILFFLPSFLLGTLSPFAIKLHQQNLDLVGQKSGEVFFYSTLGSIAGSLTTGFLFIPYLGVTGIVVGVGILLLAWGLLGISLHFHIPKKILFLTLGICLFLIGAGFLMIVFYPQRTHFLYQKDGRYEKIRIADGMWENKPARFLLQDKSNSAGRYLGSDDLAYDYTKYYSLYQLINPHAKQAFVIGGGAYSIPQALLKDSPDMKVTVSEIEPELYQLAQTYFNLKPSPRLQNITEDGRRFLTSNLKNHYDVILSDVYYSFFSIPIHFTTKEFFSLAKNRLNQDGVFIGNFVGDLGSESPSFIFSEMKTFQEVFPNSYFFAVNDKNSLAPQNIIFLGIQSDKKIDFNDLAHFSNPILQNLASKKIDISQVDFSKHQVLTDDFAPVEYMVSRVLARWY